MRPNAPGSVHACSDFTVAPRPSPADACDALDGNAPHDHAPQRHDHHAHDIHRVTSSSMLNMARVAAGGKCT